MDLLKILLNTTTLEKPIFKKDAFKMTKGNDIFTPKIECKEYKESPSVMSNTIFYNYAGRYQRNKWDECKNFFMEKIVLKHNASIVNENCYAKPKYMNRSVVYHNEISNDHNISGNVELNMNSRKNTNKSNNFENISNYQSWSNKKSIQKTQIH